MDEKYLARDILTQVSENTKVKARVLQTKDVSVWLVNLKPGEKLPMETHPDTTQIFEVRGGGGSATIGAIEHPILSVGDMIWVPRGVPHEIRAGSRGLKMTTMYAPAEHHTHSRESAE